jgi:3-oxoacyl-[acyl-carrier-protein] synthase-3
MKLSSAAILLATVANACAFAFQPTSTSTPFLGQTRITHASCASGSALSMVTTGPLNCRPIGIGSAAPTTVITNVDLESIVETSDEWIRTRTGIAERRVLLHPNEDHDEEEHGPFESIKTLSTDAAQKALDMSGLSPEDIDLVLVATSSPYDMFGDATSVAANLGCKNAVAFDLTAACSGFLFGSVTAGQFLTNAGNGYNNAIVVGADALSRWIDWDDRNSCILFGDAAGAVVLSATDDAADAGILGSSAHSDGNGYENLNCG